MDSQQGKVFLGGISFETTEERLKDYFTTFGEVVEAVIMRDRLTGRSRGFGFLLFADPAVADRLLLDSRHNIDGRMVEVKQAIYRDEQHNTSRSWHNSVGNGVLNLSRTKKIFIGGLAHTVTENDMRKYFEQFGTVTDAVIMYDPRNQRPRGFGFVTFDSEDVVDIVVQMPIHDLNGKMVDVKRAVAKEGFSGHIRFPAGRGGSFGASNGHFFNSTPTPVGSYAPPMNSSYSAAMGGTSSYSSYGPTGYNASSFGTGAGYGPAIAIGGYGSATSVNNIPSYGPGYGAINGSSYGVPVASGAGNVGLYGNDATPAPDSIMLGVPPIGYGNTSSSFGYEGPTTGSGGISHHEVAQVDNGQSNRSNAGYAAQNNGYGMGVAPYSSASGRYGDA